MKICKCTHIKYLTKPQQKALEDLSCICHNIIFPKSIEGIITQLKQDIEKTNRRKSSYPHIYWFDSSSIDKKNLRTLTFLLAKMKTEKIEGIII